MADQPYTPSLLVVQAFCTSIQIQQTRIDRARTVLARCKKGGAAEARWRAKAHDARRLETRVAADLRAHLGDETARRRLVWGALVHDHRWKVADAWREAQAQLEGADRLRARLDRGTTPSGRPYKAAAVRRMQELIAGLERSYLESVRLLRVLSEERVPSYRAWRRRVGEPALNSTGRPTAEAEAWLRRALSDLA